MAHCIRQIEDRPQVGHQRHVQVGDKPEDEKQDGDRDERAGVAGRARSRCRCGSRCHSSLFPASSKSSARLGLDARPMSAGRSSTSAGWVPWLVVWGRLCSPAFRCTQHYTGNRGTGKGSAQTLPSRYRRSACIPLFSTEKQGDKRGQRHVEQRQAEEGAGGSRRQLAGRDGGLPHLPDPGRPRHRSGARAGAAPSGRGRVGARRAVGRPHRGAGRSGARLPGSPGRRGRFAGQPRRRHRHGPAAPGDRREPPHRPLRRATEGTGRRGLDRHSRTRHRGREGPLPRAGLAAARPLHGPAGAPKIDAKAVLEEMLAKRNARAASSPARGSATPSTA